MEFADARKALHLSLIIGEKRGFCQTPFVCILDVSFFFPRGRFDKTDLFAIVYRMKIHPRIKIHKNICTEIFLRCPIKFRGSRIGMNRIVNLFN
jgi:hypothetical protein